MPRKLTVLFLPVLFAGFAFVLGCGEATDVVVSDSGASNAVAEEASDFVAKRPPKQYPEPADAVNDFLVAVITGDDELATQLLTTQAQREAWSHGLAINADGFPDARYKITEVEYLENDPSQAHVASVWENKDNYGETKSFECVWLLRKEEQGWCVAGMVTKFLPHLDPLVMNFEDQIAMEKNQHWAQQEMQKYAQLQKHQQEAAIQGPAAQQQTQQQKQQQQQPVRQANRPTQAIR